SVYHALREATGETVLLHDAARPFVTRKTISDCIESVKKYGSGICALPATDTTVIAENGKILSATDRSKTYTVQTPQGFVTKKLLRAYEAAQADGAAFTDDGSLYARYVEPPALFLGDPKNRKLTFAEDFSHTERVGFGIDTHAFYSEDECAPFVNFITLGGARIPSEKILKAHSDGDVLVHALMDALLSAAGLRDIGYYFPDTDEKYRGANSMELLAQALAKITEAGFAPQNVSISILAETPRLSPYIEEMKRNLADALTLSPSAIGIAAGTNEKLGYVGEKKGITVYATVMCSIFLT
ncbi:MAG: 2-C-methyl-D-erythritol 2,4-cyclodiphosphate synthase, partial [Clostridia bacterium]|nr:2-C-methyl-D-erythritol 2,4-cyclodiphosphate synthase [Clostridia bacterium]